MNRLKKIIAAVISGCIMIACFGGAVVSAEEQSISEIRQVMPSEPQYGEFISDYVRRIADYLSIYAKDGTTQATLYKAALLETLESHPELYEEVMSALLSSIDKHSVFYKSGEFSDFISNLESAVGGIGVTVSESEDGLFVGGVLENSPAAAAGVMTGDILYSVDGASLLGVDLDAAIGMLRGEVGSTVVLGVQRGDAGEVLYFTLVREEIGQKESVVYSIFPYCAIEADAEESNAKEDIMYIKIYTFMDNTAELFGNAIKIADEQKINNIIIDVRGNGGGYIDQAAEIANYFVPEGSIIVTEDHKVDLFDVVYKSDNKRIQKNDVVILTDKNSASASELLTAALVENKAAVSIGETTYGKGTVQSMVPLKDGEVMKYTSAYYLTPLGNNIDGVGLVPTAEVTNSSRPLDLTGFEEFEYNGIYSKGDSSIEAAKAKKILSVWGMYGGSVDDLYFDSTLENAVMRFQAQTGLFPYGVLDLTTQRKLYEMLAQTTDEVDDQLEAAFNHYGQTYLNRK